MTARTGCRPAATVEQLLILVDRADRGLTHEEQAVLRAGIGQLARAQSKSKGSAA